MPTGRIGRSAAVAVMAVTFGLLIDVHEASRSTAWDTGPPPTRAPPSLPVRPDESVQLAGRPPRAERSPQLFAVVISVVRLFGPQEDVLTTGSQTTDSTAGPLAYSYSGEGPVGDESKAQAQTRTSKPDPLPLSLPVVKYEGDGSESQIQSGTSPSDPLPLSLPVAGPEGDGTESQIQSGATTPKPLPLSLPVEGSLGDTSELRIQPGTSTPDPLPLALPEKDIINSSGNNIDEFVCTATCGLDEVRIAFFKYCVNGDGDCCSNLTAAGGHNFAACMCSNQLCDQWDAFGVRGWLHYCGIPGC